jgi:hypothetical protein
MHEPPQKFGDIYTFMPTVQSMHLPLPQHWQDFETLVRDAQAVKWNSPTLEKNGRPGQEQHGVDIYGPDYLGRPVGIQCKRFKGPLKLDVVLDEISNAEAFKGFMTTLYLATTADHDSKLQEQVRLRSEKRAKEGKFAVGLLFWDEIVSGLVLNPAVLKAHYPQLTISSTGALDRERTLAALELGYYGADLWEYVQLVYGECGWMAQTDPDELIATIRILEHRTHQLLSSQDAKPLLESLSDTRDGCLAKKTRDSDWEPVEGYAKRASSRIQKASSLLPLAESNALEVGLQLGRIYHYIDDLPEDSLRKRVELRVRQVLGSGSDDAVSEGFMASEKLTSGYQWAMHIKGLVDREVRYR